MYSILKPKPRLAVYAPNSVDPKLVDSSMQYIRKHHTISDFSLLNQNGDTICEDFYADKIYVADFFFTTCQSICPVMTDHMQWIQNQFQEDPEVLLLSHTVTPEIDDVQRLKNYAIQKGVMDSKWNLVTGDKKQIYNLARKSYLVAKSTGIGGKYDMIHTENFVLIDTKKRIRGFFDGTNKKDMKRLVKAIRILKNEGS